MVSISTLVERLQFHPSTAINQLEMWQADTFDLDTIARELGWAANLGVNFAARISRISLLYAAFENRD